MRLIHRVAPSLASLARCLLSAAVLAWCASGMAAETRPARVGLIWQRAANAADCIDRAGLERAVEARLGRDAIRGPEPVDLTVTGRIEPRPGAGWRAILVLRDNSGRPTGERVLESREGDCRSLDDPLALVLALLVDAEVSVEERPIPDAPLRLEPRQTPLQIPAGAPTRPWQVDASAGVTAIVGPLPNPTGGLRLAFGAQPPNLPRFLFDLAAWLPTRAQLGAAGAEFWALGFGLSLCPDMVRTRRFGLAGCIGQRISRVATSAFGYDENRKHASIELALEAGVRARLELTRRLVLESGVSASLPLELDHYTFASSERTTRTLFRPAPLGGVADLSVGAVFE